jgi:hypothetical protein
MVEVPRSTFNFDFEYERKILAEAEKENPNWGKFVVEKQAPPPQQQPQPPRGPRLTTSTSSMVNNISHFFLPSLPSPFCLRSRTLIWQIMYCN